MGNYHKDFDFGIKNFGNKPSYQRKNMNSSQFKRPVDELQQERIKKQRFDLQGNPFSRQVFALKLSGYKSSYFNQHF